MKISKLIDSIRVATRERKGRRALANAPASPAGAKDRALDLVEIRKSILDLLSPRDFLNAKRVNHAWYQAAHSVAMYQALVHTGIPAVRLPPELPATLDALHSLAVNEAAMHTNIKKEFALRTITQHSSPVTNSIVSVNPRLIALAFDPQQAAELMVDAIGHMTEVGLLPSEVLSTSIIEAALAQWNQGEPLDIAAHARQYGLSPEVAEQFAPIAFQASAFTSAAEECETVWILTDLTDAQGFARRQELNDLLKHVQFSASGNDALGMSVVTDRLLHFNMNGPVVSVTDIDLSQVQGEEVLTALSDDARHAYFIAAEGIYRCDLHDENPTMAFYADFPGEARRLFLSKSRSLFGMACDTGDGVLKPTLCDLRGAEPIFHHLDIDMTNSESAVMLSDTHLLVRDKPSGEEGVQPEAICYDMSVEGCAPWRITTHLDPQAKVMLSKRWAVFAGPDNLVFLDLAGQKVFATLLRPDARIGQAALSPTGNAFAVSEDCDGLPSRTIIFDLNGEMPRGRGIGDNPDEVFALQFSPDGVYLATAFETAVEICAMDSVEPAYFSTLLAKPALQNALKFTPDGRALYVSFQDGNLTKLDFASPLLAQIRFQQEMPQKPRRRFWRR